MGHFTSNMMGLQRDFNKDMEANMKQTEQREKEIDQDEKKLKGMMMVGIFTGLACLLIVLAIFLAFLIGSAVMVFGYGDETCPDTDLYTPILL